MTGTSLKISKNGVTTAIGKIDPSTDLLKLDEASAKAAAATLNKKLGHISTIDAALKACNECSKLKKKARWCQTLLAVRP